MSELEVRSAATSPVNGNRPTSGRGLMTWWVPASMPGHGEYLLKRPLDVVLSVFGLLITAPAFAIVAVLIKLEDGGPLFYVQERVGRHGKPFRLFKFRSMVADAEARTGPVRSANNDPRITRVGRMLRRTALDELPQVVNILRGDISFVGYRSIRAFFEEKSCSEIPGYADRYRARPGLTGLAQVFAGRDSPAFQKLRFDLLYLRRQNLALDLKLIGASILISLLRKWDDHEGRSLRLLRRLVRLGSSRWDPAQEP